MKYFISFVFLGLVMVSSCGGKKAPQAGAATPAQSTGTAAVSASSDVEDFTPPVGAYSSVQECPVGGNKFTVDKDTKALKYKGKVYYFCCPACISDFRKNPEKYIRY